MTIRVSAGFEEAHREQVAALFWAAFETKLGPSLGTGQRPLDFLTAALRSDYAFTAVDAEGTLLGAAGIKTAKGGFMSGTYSDLRRVYGWFGAAWRGAILAQYDQPVRDGVLYVDGIFVREEARGMGVGTELLKAVTWTARMNRYQRLQLDVVVENPGARALYERLGFEPIGSVKAGVLSPLLGFTEATTMALDVS